MKHMLPIGLASILLTASASLRAVVIDSGSVANDAWTYSLSYDDLVQGMSAAENTSATSGNKFFNDVESSSNIVAYKTNNGSSGGTLRATLGMADETTTASFTYKFDFGSSGYAIANFTVIEPWRFDFTANTGATFSYTSSYSLTGKDGSWVQINTSGNVTAYKAETSITTVPDSAGESVDASVGVSVIYYKVELASSRSITATSYSVPRAMQFGYVQNIEATTPFSIDFNLTAVPEPSTIAMILGACGLLVATVLRPRRK
jgi:hypothetical protein